MVQETDEELVKKIQSGEVLVFEEIVKRYQKRLLRFVSRIIYRESTAEEVVQDTFLKAYLAIDRIDTTRKFSTYLFEIAKNTAISELRKDKRDLPLFEEILDSGSETHLEKISRDQDNLKVRQAVELLEEKYRRIVRLYYFEELSYEEVAQKLRIPLNTVRTHLRRAKEKLKEILKNNEDLRFKI